MGSHGLGLHPEPSLTGGYLIICHLMSSLYLYYYYDTPYFQTYSTLIKSVQEKYLYL